MSRSAAIRWNGIALGLAVCSLFAPGLHRVLQQGQSAGEVAEEAALLAVFFGGLAFVLSLLLRIGGVHREQPIVQKLNTAALLISLVVTSGWVLTFVFRTPEQPPQTMKEETQKLKADEFVNPVRHGDEPNVLLVWDYVVNLDMEKLSELGLSIADVESVLKKAYEPYLKKPGTDAVILRGDALDARHLPQRIIGIREGMPIYLEDIATIRDPQGRPFH